MGMWKVGNGGKSWKGVERGGAHKLAEEEREGFFVLFSGESRDAVRCERQRLFLRLRTRVGGSPDDDDDNPPTEQLFPPLPVLFLSIHHHFCRRASCGREERETNFSPPSPLCVLPRLHSLLLPPRIPTTPLEYERAKGWRRRLRRRKRDLSPPHSLVSISLLLLFPPFIQ